MKKVFHFLFLFSTISIIFVSCKKEHNEVKYVSLDVTLLRGAGYQLDLRQYGDMNDKAVIATQALDYTSSEITTDAASQGYIYKYATSASPKTTSTGKDMVVLKISKPGGRCGKDHGETDITIRFTLQ